MRTEQHKRLSFSLSTSIVRTLKLAAYFILLLLSYTLGYLSHPSQFSPILPQLPVSPAVLHLSATTINTTDLHPFQVTTQCADPVPPETIRQTLIDRLFNGTSPFFDFPPVYIKGKLRRTTKVKGWGSKGAVFENLIREVKPRIIVEVGTFLGASALHMAELIQRLGLKTQILCIDDFRGWAGFKDRFNNIAMVNGDVLLYYQFLQNVVTFNKTDSILPIPFSSGSGLMKLCEWGVWADLVEIDAGHDFFSAWSDINRGYLILRPGGVMFGHDYFTAADNRGVRRAVDLFARIYHLKVKIDGQHWVIHSI